MLSHVYSYNFNPESHLSHCLTNFFKVKLNTNKGFFSLKDPYYLPK
ncbi:hypothetical protein ADICYQ_4901 [Cyclobacterium qasimii M12-11B]|uniref:Uncharacterized protein n=1 Tax=Cyclobacterium qasimii M12-11B TaxID=641524 RepID=S7WQ22_9BACT|nr:hypothetical protein ADICYQ_4901 [Cyclobacterium qasimii M12-11B]